MAQTISSDLFKDTPTITVLDNRGLHVRTVQFNRRMNKGTPSALDTLISHHSYNAIGQLTSSADPRFFDQGTRNLTQILSLTGQTLQVDSIDAGWRVSLPDITQAPRKEWEERGTLRRYEYDTDFHRPTAVIEQPDATTSAQVTEHFIYGDAQDVSNNLNQQLMRHYDNAGVSTINSISLTGQTLSEQRQLLSSLTDDSDWQGDTEAAWQANLASSTYTTHRAYNALGTLLSQTDAKGNRQRSEYDVAGYLSATYLQAADAKTEQVIVSGIEYNANGQKVQETAGNNVETTYTYDERDWRLMQTCTQRPLVPGRTTILQNLGYEYDPAGNIISINDLSQATHFYKNQQVTAQCRYEYDTSYQLTSATGRENDAMPAQSSALPSLNDSHQYVNYTRTYHYDRGNNLTQVHHTGASQYTLDMVVSAQSNRAVQQHATSPMTPDEVDAHFDAHGNLQQLEHSKALIWGRRDQLKQARVTTNQQESYQYAVAGSRVRKTFSDSGSHTEREVVYLPGLELRLTRQNGSVSEELQVVTIANAGRAQVRLLHWASGKPAAETDIPNNQLRYTLDNHLGSSHLELDENADILTMEEYYPFGGTAVCSAKSATEAKYKTIRYSGQERDVTGLYYYGYRYYAAWMGRWLNPDPAWTVDGLNLYRMVRNNPVTGIDQDGRMFKTVATGMLGVGGAAYEVYKHRDKQTKQPSAPTAATTTESYGNQQLGKIGQKANDIKTNYDPVKQMQRNIVGRKEAVEHIAQGQLPGINAIKKGVETVTDIGSFAASGNVNELNKSALTKAAVTDTVKNAQLSLKAIQKAAKTAAIAGTVTQEKIKETEKALDDLKEVATDTVITGASLSMTVGAALDAAATVAPHPVAKVGLKGLSLIWKATGVIHTAEELAKLSEKREELISNEFGKELNKEIKEANKIRQGDLISAIRKQGFIR